MIVHELVGELEVKEKFGAIVLDVPNAETHTVSISPPNKLASYDLRLINSHGYEIYRLKNRIGKTKRRIDALVANNCTLEISNASHPGDYTYFLSLKS